MDCHQFPLVLPSDSSKSEAEAANSEIQLDDRLPLPPPTKFDHKYSKTSKLGDKTAQPVSDGPTRLERLAAHKAAISRMVTSDEPAQWASNSDVLESRMWEHQFMLQATAL